MMTSEDLKLDLITFINKAVAHMKDLPRTDIEGVLRTFTIIAGRMALAYDEVQKPVSSKELNSELQLLWSLFGTSTGTSYQIWVRQNQIESRLLNLEKDRGKNEKKPSGERAH